MPDGHSMFELGVGRRGFTTETLTCCKTTLATSAAFFIVHRSIVQAEVNTTLIPNQTVSSRVNTRKMQEIKSTIRCQKLRHLSAGE